MESDSSIKYLDVWMKINEVFLMNKILDGDYTVGKYS
jgi:hypothetical protein